MTILVHGAFGFVGRHLVKRLKSDGHSVTALGRGPWEVKWQTYDAIVNCAAELTAEDDMWGSNTSLVHDMLNLVRQGLAKRFIQIGSSSEYGRIDSVRREDSVCQPSNIYEATKLAATSLCQGYAARYDLDICVARPFSLFGPGDKARKLIPSLYRSYIEHKPFSLFPGAHDWVYIDDFIDGLILLLNADRAQTKGQIFNFGTGISSSNLEVVSAMESALGGKLDIRYQTGARFHAHDVDNWVADSTKARTLLNWQPKHTLQSGMHEYVMAEWFGQQGDKG